jgi:predicted nucleic acid-binding protein
VTQIVVDASLAVKWALQESDTAEAEHLLQIWLDQGVELLGPSWYACEASNVLFQRVRGAQIDAEKARLDLLDLLGLITVTDYEPAVAIRALALAIQLGQRATYDCHYLALAEYLDCEYWTADLRFWTATRVAFPRVRWIGEAALEPD